MTASAEVRQVRVDPFRECCPRGLDRGVRRCSISNGFVRFDSGRPRFIQISREFLFTLGCVSGGVPGSSGRGCIWHLEGVLNDIELGQFPWNQKDFNNIEAEFDRRIAEQAQPGERATLNETLLVRRDRVGGAAKSGRGSCLHFHKAKHVTVPRHNVYFAAVGATVVAVEHPPAALAQAAAREEFAQQPQFPAGELCA